MEREVDEVVLLILGVEDSERGNPLPAEGGGDNTSNSQYTSGSG